MLQKKGRKCDMKDNVLIEYYPGKTYLEVAETVEQSIEIQKEKFKGVMNINYTVETII